MTLRDWLARKLRNHPRLRAVPVPVVEEVIALVIHAIDCDLPLPASTTLADALDSDWVVCESCETWTERDKAVSGGEDCDLCRDCAARLTAEGSK